MWGRNRKTAEATVPDGASSDALKDAVRRTRLEIAEQSSVVVDLRDAELARLELLNDALDPLFAEVPSDIVLFDRGISRGDTPRLWVDAIAHVAMGRDKRRYRFLLDTRYGRRVLADSNDIGEIVEAVTHYVASRIIERERALAAGDSPLGMRMRRNVLSERRRRRWRMIWVFLFGLIAGSIAVIAAAWIVALQMPH
jgi:hypothetical protein